MASLEHQGRSPQILQHIPLADLRSFNDGWRRHMAHPRPDLELHDDEALALEALALYGHVSRFLKKVATKISEGVYTPLRWT